MNARALDKPLRNLGWLLGGRGIHALCSLLYLSLAARSLGLKGFGEFSLLVLMAQMISGLASFSAWQMIVRWGTKLGSAAPAAGFAVALDILAVAIGSCLASASVWSAPLWLPLPEDLRATALALCLAHLAAIRSTPIGVLRFHDRYDGAALAEASLPLVRAIGAVIAAILMPTVAGYALVWGIAELICAGVHWYLASRIEPIARQQVSLRALPASDAEVWPFVWATSLSRSLAVAAKQAFALLVGAIGGAAMLGAFRLAAQIGQALVQFAELVSRAVYPELVRDVERAGVIALRMTWLALSAGSLAVLIAALFGERLITTIAGSGFAVARDAMVVIAIAGATDLLATSAEALLVARGQPWRALAWRAAPVAVAMIALAPAMKVAGLAGAAGCLLLASVLGAIGLGYSAGERATSR